MNVKKLSTLFLAFVFLSALLFTLLPYLANDLLRAAVPFVLIFAVFAFRTLHDEAPHHTLLPLAGGFLCLLAVSVTESFWFLLPGVAALLLFWRAATDAEREGGRDEPGEAAWPLLQAALYATIGTLLLQGALLLKGRTVSPTTFATTLLILSGVFAAASWWRARRELQWAKCGYGEPRWRSVLEVLVFGGASVLSVIATEWLIRGHVNPIDIALQVPVLLVLTVPSMLSRRREQLETARHRALVESWRRERSRLRNR